MPFIDKINQLAAAKAKVADLEKTLTDERVQALSALPSDFGYSDLNSFIKALKEAATSKAGRKAGRKGKGAAKAPKAPKAAKKAARTRAKITEELKSLVIADVQAGKSGAEIAAAHGISLPSVQNIKKAAGLVKARSTEAEAPAAPAAQ